MCLLDVRLYHVRHKRSEVQCLYTHERWWWEISPGYNQEEQLCSHQATKRLATTSKGHRLFRWTWKRANQTDPTGEARSTEYGWKENNNRLEPERFQEGMSQKLSEPLVETMPQPAWMTPHLTSVMFRLTRTMNEPNGWPLWRRWWHGNGGDNIHGRRIRECLERGERWQCRRRSVEQHSRTLKRTSIRQSNILNRKRPDYRRTVRNVIIHKQRRAPILLQGYIDWNVLITFLHCYTDNTI